jgi:hypothetical protein
MHEELRSHWGPRARLPAVDATPPPLPEVNLALCPTMPVKKKRWQDSGRLLLFAENVTF